MGGRFEQNENVGGIVIQGLVNKYRNLVFRCVCGLCAKKKRRERRENMGWVWRDDDDESSDSGSFGMAGFQNPNSGYGDHCSTRRIVQTKCNTEEVEPGKFVKKCEKTEQILRDCVGTPAEIVQSNKEYTEEDVAHDIMRRPSFPGSSDVRPFEFPGLRSDIEGIERNFFGGINRFFEVADEMRNSFFHLMNDPSLFGGHSSSSAARRQGVPIEDHIRKERETGRDESKSGSIDLSGLARDV